MAAVDILIAGDGPAAASTAVALARFAPQLKVVMAAPAVARRDGLAEALSPLILPVLSHLGLRSAFLAQGFSSSHRSFAAWGAPVLTRREHLLDARGPAWRVDRRHFDRWLAREAEGATTRVRAKVKGLEQSVDGWSVTCADGEHFSARLVVDATGRAAALSRLRGHGGRFLDRLVSVAAWAPAGGHEPELVIESVPEGWWYSLVLGSPDADARRLAVCVTDADIVRRLRLATRAGWTEALARTRFVSAAAGPPDAFDAPVVGPACSRVTLAADEALLSVGDAALALDPISGQGVVNALRSGIFAAYAASDHLNGDATALQRYATWTAARATASETGLSENYSTEQRWRDQPFWRRRLRPEVVFTKSLTID